MSEGVDVNLDEFVRAASGLRRLLESVGLKRIAGELKNNPLIDYFNRPPSKCQYVHDAHDEDDMMGMTPARQRWPPARLLCPRRPAIPVNDPISDGSP